MIPARDEAFHRLLVTAPSACYDEFGSRQNALSGVTRAGLIRSLP